MTSSTFGFYVGIVYIQKGVVLLVRGFEPLPLDNSTGWLSVAIAMLFCISVYLVTAIGKTSYLPFQLRTAVGAFAFAAGCLFWTGFSHFPENSLRDVPIERLPITRAFFPTMDRSWFIDFWNIEARWAFVGAPLGFLITLLFWFDHNVSSVMAQAKQFPVKRPAGFHWDFFLLGITTLVSGLLGLPAPNGLVPQCPWHTESLSAYKQVKIAKEDEETSSEKPTGEFQGRVRKQPTIPAREEIVNTRVVEQRGSHLLIGAITLATMTRPFLVALGTMPRAIFAGIFLLVGWSSIEGNPITSRTLALFKDRSIGSPDDPLNQIRRRKIALFVGIQWFFFAITFAISETIAGIGFPVLITLLIPFRYAVVPKWFSPLELRVLDAPTADAVGVLASIGHEAERCTGQGAKIAADTKIAGTEYDVDENDGSNSGRGQAGSQSSSDEEEEAQPYVIDDGEQFVMHRSQRSVDASSQSAPAVQSSPFAVPTTFNMNEPGIAHMTSESGSKIKRKSLIGRLLHGSQQEQLPPRKQDATSNGKSTTSGPSKAEGGQSSAANIPAMPASAATSAPASKYPTTISGPATDVPSQSAPRSTAAAASGMVDEAPQSPLEEATPVVDQTQPATDAPILADGPTESDIVSKEAPSSQEPVSTASQSGPASGTALLADGPTASDISQTEPASQANGTSDEVNGSTAAPEKTSAAAAAPLAIIAAQDSSAPAAQSQEGVPEGASTSDAPATEGAPFAAVGSRGDAPTSTEVPRSVEAIPAQTGPTLTTSELATEFGIAGGTAASGLALAAGRKEPDDVDHHQAAMNAASDTMTKAQGRQRQLEQEKRKPGADKKSIKEEIASEKHRAAEAKKVLKEETKKRDLAIKARSEKEKTAKRNALLAAKKKENEDKLARESAAKAKKEKEAEEKREKERAAIAAKESAAREKREKEEEAAKAKQRKLDEKEALDEQERLKKKTQEEQAKLDEADKSRKASQAAAQKQLASDQSKIDESAKKRHEAEALLAGAAAAGAALLAKQHEDEKKSESAQKELLDQQEQVEKANQDRLRAEEEASRATQEAESQAAKLKEENDAKARSLEAELAQTQRDNEAKRQALESELLEAQKKADQEKALAAAALATALADREREEKKLADEREASRVQAEEEQKRQLEELRLQKESEEKKVAEEREAIKRKQQEEIEAVRKQQAEEIESAKRLAAEEIAKAKKSADEEIRKAKELADAEIAKAKQETDAQISRAHQEAERQQQIEREETERLHKEALERQEADRKILEAPPVVAAPALAPSDHGAHLTPSSKTTEEAPHATEEVPSSTREIPVTNEEVPARSNDDSDTELAALAATAAAVVGGGALAHEAGSSDKAAPVSKSVEEDKATPSSTTEPTTPSKKPASSSVKTPKSSVKEHHGGFLKKIFGITPKSEKTIKSSSKPTEEKTSAVPKETSAPAKKDSISAPRASTTSAQGDKDKSDKIIPTSTEVSPPTKASRKSLDNKSSRKVKSKSSNKDLPIVPVKEDEKTASAVPSNLKRSNSKAGTGSAGESTTSLNNATGKASAPTSSRLSSVFAPLPGSKSSTSPQGSTTNGAGAASARPTTGASTTITPISSSAKPSAAPTDAAKEPKEETREIIEGDKVFIEHVNPRFAKYHQQGDGKSTSGSRKTVSAVQWRKLDD